MSYHNTEISKQFVTICREMAYHGDLITNILGDKIGAVALNVEETTFVDINIFQKL